MLIDIDSTLVTEWTLGQATTATIRWSEKQYPSEGFAWNTPSFTWTCATVTEDNRSMTGYKQLFVTTHAANC